MVITDQLQKGCTKKVITDKMQKKGVQSPAVTFRGRPAQLTRNLNVVISTKYCAIKHIIGEHLCTHNVWVTWCGMAAGLPIWAGLDSLLFVHSHGESGSVRMLTWPLPDRDSIQLLRIWICDVQWGKKSFSLRLSYAWMSLPFTTALSDLEPNLP